MLQYMRTEYAIAGVIRYVGQAPGNITKTDIFGKDNVQAIAQDSAQNGGALYVKGW